MNVTYNTRIQNATADQDSRYGLTSVQLQHDGNGTARLVATDGRIAAVAHTEVDVPKDAKPSRHLIPKRVFKWLRSEARRVLVRTQDDGLGTWEGHKCTAEEELTNFPNVSDVLPNVDDTYQEVSLDADLLKKISDAITHQHEDDGKPGRVSLFLPQDPRKPIGVVGDRGIGVIMPVAMDTNTKKPTRTTPSASRSLYKAERETFLELDRKTT